LPAAKVESVLAHIAEGCGGVRFRPDVIFKQHNA
jgi:hypothetical protein